MHKIVQRKIVSFWTSEALRILQIHDMEIQKLCINMKANAKRRFANCFVSVSWHISELKEQLPKMKILWSFILPYVISNLSENKKKIFFKNVGIPKKLHFYCMGKKPMQLNGDQRFTNVLQNIFFLVL